MSRLDFSNSRVVILGDAMLDRYLHGDTSRISPEAPVPVVNIESEEVRVGGAANVAMNVAGLGAASTLIAAIGEDEAGKQLTALLETQHVHCDFIQSSSMNTITKLRVIGRHQQLLRLDFEKYQGWAAQFLSEKLTSALKEANVLILSDYAKGMLADAKALIKIAKAQDVKIIVDPKSNDFSVYQGADVLTPNLKEFEAAVGPCKDDVELVEKAFQVLDKCDFEALLVTRGAQGMTLIERKTRAFHHIPTQAREVYDITGAGDTVIAVLAACLSNGMDYLSSSKMANRAAGLAVAKLGTVMVSIEELEQALHEDATSVNTLGIYSKEDLLNEIKTLRAKNQKIVMTNGCFDLLHTGHLSYLQEAKSLGDYLIVAVNDDASVKRLKGATRPLNNLQDRMTALAALKSVDYVVNFSEDTPRDLIAAILPDILVKGGDYEVSQIAGAKEVLENGGDVKILSFVEGYSTTRLFNRIYELNELTISEAV